MFRQPKIPLYPLCGYLTDVAVAYAPVSIRLNDLRENTSRLFHYSEGLKSYLAELTHYESGIVLLEAMEGDTHVRMAVQLCLNLNSFILHTFANDTRTVDGGSHVDGFIRACRQLAKQHHKNIMWRLIFGKPDSLAAIIAVTAPNPGLSGPLHLGLDNPKVEEMVYRMALECLSQFCDRRGKERDAAN